MRLVDWLRLLLQSFYAPLRGLREVRDRGSLSQAALVALLSQLAYFLVTQWLASGRTSLLIRPGSVFRILAEAATPTLLIACIFVPIAILIANLFERRGSFGLVLQQEYVSAASTVFYALTIANLVSLVVSLVFNVTGFQAAYVANSAESTNQIKGWLLASGNLSPEMMAQLELLLSDPAFIALGLFRSVKLSLFVITATLAVREVFRFTIVRAVVVMLVSLLLALLLSPLWALLLSPVLASPFLLIILFLLVRGYVSGMVQSHRARESFRRNLEAATLNPADASAHYNLGLIQQQRGELEQARERFERAIQIDEDEIDAHYQLGRIARQQKRLADAIKHFEQVVARDPSHAQQEVWREVGATYVAAGQFGDAINALEQFLERRPSDPEALYLMGRAHAGLGHRREAANSMKACIEAVNTSPAYKYRASKRWLNEAQQFLRSQPQEH